MNDLKVKNAGAGNRHANVLENNFGFVIDMGTKDE